MTIIIKDSGVLSWKVSGAFLGALRNLFPLVGVLILSIFQKFEIVFEIVFRVQKEHFV